MKWMVLKDSKGTPDFFGLFYTKEEALYAIYLELEPEDIETTNNIREMITSLLERRFIGDRGLSYHLVEVDDLIKNPSPLEEDLSFADFLKILRETEKNFTPKSSFQGKPRGKSTRPVQTVDEVRKILEEM